MSTVCVLQRLRVQRVARELLDGQGDALVVEEESRLDDGLGPVLLADAPLPQPLDRLDLLRPVVRHALHLLVGVGVLDLEEEVCHVVEHRAGLAPRPARDARVHAPQDLATVPLDDRQRVVDVVAVAAGHDGVEPLLVLGHGRALRRGVEDPAVHEQPHDARQVVAQLRRMLDAREEGAQPERVEHRVEDRRRHELRLAKALRIPGLERDGDHPRLRLAHEPLERGYQRLPVPERLSEPSEVVRPAVVELGQRADAQPHLLAHAAPAVGRNHALALDQPQVVDSVVVVPLNVHRRSFMQLGDMAIIIS